MRPDIGFAQNSTSFSRPVGFHTVELPTGVTEQPRKRWRGDETFASRLGGFCDYQLMTRLPRFLTPLLAGCAVTLLQVVMAVTLLAPEEPIAERYSALIQHDSYWFMKIIDRGYQTIVPPINHKVMEVSNVAFFPAYPAYLSYSEVFHCPSSASTSRIPRSIANAKPKVRPHTSAR